MSCLFRPRRVPFPAPAPPSPHDALFSLQGSALPSTLLFLTLLNPLSSPYVIAEQQQTRVIRETPRNLNRTQAYPCHIKQATCMLSFATRNPLPMVSLSWQVSFFFSYMQAHLCLAVVWPLLRTSPHDPLGIMIYIYISYHKMEYK